MSDNRKDRLFHSIPFLVNVRDLSNEQIDDMVNTLINDFGATSRFGKDIFMDVLEDLQKEAADPLKFQYGPYVGLRTGHKGELALAHAREPDEITKTSNRGVTIYGYDQFIEFAKDPEAFMEGVRKGERLRDEMKSEQAARRKHSHDSGMGMG